MRYFLDVHNFAPVSAVKLEMDWIDTQFLRWTEMVTYRNRFVHMQQDRLSKIIYNWHKFIKTKAWVS